MEGRTTRAFEARRLRPGETGTATEFVCANLRAEDQYEATAAGICKADVPGIVGSMTQYGEAYLLWFREQPTFVWGVAPGIPGNFSLWGFGTKNTRRAMPSITRWGIIILSQLDLVAPSPHLGANSK